MQKATRQQTKDHNTRLILKTLFETEPMSRADIARATRLTRPTVSSIIAELIEADFVQETGTGPSAGGKPPIMLAINQDAYHIIAVDLGSRDFRAARTNLRGDIVQSVEVPAEGAPDGDRSLELTMQMIDALLAAASAPVLGIGLGAPGVIDPHEGVVRRAVNLGWTNLPIRELLEARYGLTTHVINDSHAAALAEYMFGEPRMSNNLILIKLSQGIGAGIILDGQPLYGDGFGAGEIGHLVVQTEGERCSCGNRGCLETVAGTRALLHRARALEAPGLTWAALVARYQAGDAAIAAMVAEAGKALGVAVASLIAAFNVETIVFAGRMTELGLPLLEMIEQEARRRALPNMVDETALSFSTLGPEMVQLGCSALILQQELGVV